MMLRLEKIRKEFDDKVAVDDLSLEVPEGVIYGIIGPNGAGKTTTIRMIMNIIGPDSGRVMFRDREVDDTFKNFVGYLPEERGLYKKMVVADVITYMAELKGRPASFTRPKIDPWLDRMGLLDYKQHKVQDLSKGMAQKLQFITTIIHEPPIVILDEIFSGLDPINMELLKEIILELKRNGTTVLFSTHVMEQAEKLCDHLCMINRGQKVVDGKLAEVKSRFGSNSMQLDIDGDGSFIRDLPGVSGVTEFTNHLELKLHDGADSKAILRAVLDRVSVNRFAVQEPSLYDIFIDLARVDPSRIAENGEAGHV